MTMVTYYRVYKDGRRSEHDILYKDLFLGEWKGLDPEQKYVMGLDPSTSCTGVCIANTAMTDILMVDISNTQKQRGPYVADLKFILRALVRNLKIVLLCSEKPPASNRVHAGNVLKELKGTIESWKYEIPELGNIPEKRWVSLYPQTWMSEVMDESKGKGRYRKMPAIADDLCDIFTPLRPYIAKCPGKDLDSFAALGVLHGYIQQTFRGNDIVITGDKAYMGDVKIFVRLVSDDSEKTIYEFLGTKRNMPLLALNPDKSFYQNVMIGATQHERLVVKVSGDIEFSLRMRYSLPLNDQKLLVYIVRQSVLTESFLKKAEEILPHETFREWRISNS